jgi:triosephosphate isomerase
MRKPLVIANWKMNTDLADASLLTTSIKNVVGDLDVEVALCPPFVWLYPMKEILYHAPKNLHLGAQNMWFTPKGAMTGEISPLMLKGMVKYVILGHSDRRKNLGETTELINDKIRAALENNLIPIVCIGELKKQDFVRAKGRPTKLDVNSDIARLLEGALQGISEHDAEKIIAVYEPVWAISTNSGGQAANGAYANFMAEKLRNVFATKYNSDLAERVKILYGGSVDEDNIKEYIYQPEIDGVLVGAASLRVKEFIKICREAAGKE